MTTAAERYAATYDAAVAADRFTDHRMPGDHWSDIADLFRLDPRRPWDQNLNTIAGYLEPSDRFLDVGGGAGRISLALADQVKEIILVEPSDSMREQFIAARDEAGITNARVTPDWWMESPETGEVVHISDVSYFVRDIVPFVTKLHNAASRRVIVSIWRPTPGDMDADLRRVLFGEEPVCWPGLPQLAAVLWEMELLPEILPLREPPWWIPELSGGLSDEEAMDFALIGWIATTTPPGDWSRRISAGFSREPRRVCGQRGSRTRERCCSPGRPAGGGWHSRKFSNAVIATSGARPLTSLAISPHERRLLRQRDCRAALAMTGRGNRQRYCHAALAMTKRIALSHRRM